MLQRVQSIYLLLAALCSAATWFLPVRTWSGDACVTFRTHGLFRCDGTLVADADLPVPFQLLHSVIAVVLVVAIFLFGNRPRQARVVRGLWLFAMAAAVLQFISCNSIDAWLKGGGDAAGVYGPSFYLPFATMLLAFLAERAIRKDDELVRSADRLR